MNYSNDIILLCKKAIFHLKKAEEYFEKSKRLGLLDIFSKGIVMSIIKNSKIEKANDELLELRSYVDELRGIISKNNLEIKNFDVENLNYNLEIFFNNIISNSIIQNKIENKIEDIKLLTLKFEEIIFLIKNK
ncbi:hypothetical protein [Gemelliphila palaticanis]|uniref:Uncharacterized protein n=1 Tax=Gemelliphila palaticanis TaxID=81950 RepID=A0ABX2SZA7_9BACL|nr:hypothetical protein [Gemella palaticanis]MBF0715772.1 hypothetical protein [Gemella palaticanis]NYS47702.1 hypothetical protein [Gemella palaticanis]